jgi:hypothetical protein
MNRKICALGLTKAAIAEGPGIGLKDSAYVDLEELYSALCASLGSGIQLQDDPLAIDWEQLWADRHSANPLLRAYVASMSCKASKEMVGKLTELFSDEDLMVRHMAARSAAILLNFKDREYQTYCQQIGELRYAKRNFSRSRLEDRFAEDLEKILHVLSGLNTRYAEGALLRDLEKEADFLQKVLARENTHGAILALLMLLLKEEQSFTDFAFFLYLSRAEGSEFFPYLAILGLGHSDPKVVKLVVGELYDWAKKQQPASAGQVAEVIRKKLEELPQIYSLE